MTKMEVRCCCHPERLYGWLQVETPQRHYIAFMLRDTIEGELGSRLDNTTMDVKTITFKIQSIVVNGITYRAINAMETPLEILERIPGFEKNSKL